MPISRPTSDKRARKSDFFHIVILSVAKDLDFSLRFLRHDKHNKLFLLNQNRERLITYSRFSYLALFCQIFLNIRLVLARHGAGILAHSGANPHLGENPGIQDEPGSHKNK
jgi:hypothetical protein